MSYSPSIGLCVMVGLVAQGGAVLVKAAVLWRHEDADLKLLLRPRHVHKSESVIISLLSRGSCVHPPIQTVPVVPLHAVEDEAAVEADQLPGPHWPLHKQTLARPLHCAGQHNNCVLLKRVGQVLRNTETVKVWRTVGQRSISKSACPDDLDFFILKVYFLDFTLIS